jgi:Collagen triple helix repeat (20 copies)
MFSRIRRRLTYANVALTLALVFAMSGGAFAAGHYLITSTKQISPKVLKALRGSVGANGAQGAVGPAGPAGPAGPQGPVGANGAPGAPGKEGAPGKDGKNGETGFTEALPSEKTEMGTWSLAVPPVNPTIGSSVARASISFVIPLEATPKAHFLKVEEGGTAECPGTAENPQAAPGNLCVYAGSEVNAPTEILITSEKFGAILGNGLYEPTHPEPGGVEGGSWAVTAE